MSKPGRRVNRAELADVFGVSLPTIDSWVRDGCPFAEKGAKGREWAFETAAVYRWLIDRAVGDAVETAGGEAGRVTKDEADRRRAVAQAIAEEVSTAELLNSVLSEPDAVADVAAFTIALRTGLANVSGKIAGRTASMTVPAEIQEFVEAEMNKAFDAAQAELVERWAHAEPDGDGSGGEDRPSPGG